MTEIAGRLKLTGLAVRRRTDQLRTALKSFFGDSVIAEVCRTPQWFNDLRAVKEHLACRGERSWQTHWTLELRPHPCLRPGVSPGCRWGMMG